MKLLAPRVGVRARQSYYVANIIARSTPPAEPHRHTTPAASNGTDTHSAHVYTNEPNTKTRARRRRRRRVRPARKVYMTYTRADIMIFLGASERASVFVFGAQVCSTAHVAGLRVCVVVLWTLGAAVGFYDLRRINMRRRVQERSVFDIVCTETQPAKPAVPAQFTLQTIRSLAVPFAPGPGKHEHV